MRTITFWYSVVVLVIYSVLTVASISALGWQALSWLFVFSFFTAVAVGLLFVLVCKESKETKGKCPMCE